MVWKLFAVTGAEYNWNSLFPDQKEWGWESGKQNSHVSHSDGKMHIDIDLDIGVCVCVLLGEMRFTLFVVDP